MVGQRDRLPPGPMPLDPVDDLAGPLEWSMEGCSYAEDGCMNSPMVGQRRSLAQGPIPSDPLTSPVPTSCAASSSLRIDALEQQHDGPYSCDLPKEPGDLVPLGEGLSTVADTDHVPMAAFLAVPRGSAPLWR